MSDIQYGSDDRKTLLDVYYDGGGKVGEDVTLRDIYPGLIAVANYALAEERALGASEDGKAHDAEVRQLALNDYASAVSENASALYWDRETFVADIREWANTK